MRTGLRQGGFMVDWSLVISSLVIGSFGHWSFCHCSFPMRRFWILVLLTLMAFGLRAGSLTAQSLWRDEVDALCYAHEFPHLLWEALAPERAGDLQTPCACPPPPLPTEASARGPRPEGWTAGTLRERVVGLLGAMIRQNGPLYYFLLRGWVALAGHTEYALRFFSLLLGVLCVPLTAALGTRLLGRTAATFAAALMAASAYMVWYGQEVKMYTLVPALVLLALYGLRRGMDEGGIWWAVQVVATTLLLYTHIWGALLIPLQILWLLLEWPRWQPRWRGALVGMALLTLPYLPLAVWQAPAALARRETGFPHHTLGEMALILLNGWSTGILSRGWPWGALACGGMAALGLAWGLARPARGQSVGAGLAPAPKGQPQEGQPQGLPLQAPAPRGQPQGGQPQGLPLHAPAPRGQPVGAGLAPAPRGQPQGGQPQGLPLQAPAPRGQSVGAGLAPAPKGQPQGPRPDGARPEGLPLQVPALHFLALWLTVPLLIIWLISLRQPLFTDRYLIWCAPAFYLLAGQGWAVLKKTTKTRRQKRIFHFVSLCLCGIIFFIFALNLHAQATIPIKSDVRAAAAYVESRYQTGDLLIFQIPHIRYTFDYYFGPTDYLWADGLYTNHRTEGGEYRLSEDSAGRWMALIVGEHSRVWLVASEVEMWDERNLVQGWLEQTLIRADEAHFTRVDVYKYQR